LFSYYKFYLKKFKTNIKSFFKILYTIARLSKISLFGYNNSGVFCRSVGSYGLVLSTNSKLKLTMVKLPSTKKILISWYTLCLLGKIKSFYKKKLLNTKAGYLRLLGKKANSRGVSMNPIDHPHGCNTKSIKFKRTP
jgi:ribosomal protein L2